MHNAKQLCYFAFNLEKGEVMHSAPLTNDPAENARIMDGIIEAFHKDHGKSADIYAWCSDEEHGLFLQSAQPSFAPQIPEHIDFFHTEMQEAAKLCGYPIAVKNKHGDMVMITKDTSREEFDRVMLSPIIFTPTERPETTASVNNPGKAQGR